MRTLRDLEKAVDASLDSANLLSKIKNDGSCRRAIATAYYSLFWELTIGGAHLLLGDSAHPEELTRVSRAFGHKTITAVAEKMTSGVLGKFVSDEVKSVSTCLKSLYANRISADYEPLWNQAEALAESSVSRAREAVSLWRTLGDSARVSAIIMMLGLKLGDDR
jgi:uncharacterized protein (UPF0332 family)